MKKLMTTVLSLCLALALAAPAFAYDYTIPAPSGPAYADATSIETVIGVPIKAQRSGFDGERSRSGMSELSPSGGSEGYGACGDDGAAKNEDVSKNAAYIPPVFGSQSAYTPNAAPRLTPDLAPETRAAAGAAIGSDFRTLGFITVREMSLILTVYSSVGSNTSNVHLP